MSEKREMICISCPIGCSLQVYEESGKIIVEGNTCKRGEAYGISEFTNPVRMVTSVMRVAGQDQPVPVRLSKPVSKRLIPDVLSAIAGAQTSADTKRYDVILENVCESGADVIAAADAHK